MKEKKKQRYKENQNVDKTDIILTKDKELDRQKTRYSEKLTRNKNRRRKIYIIFSHKKNPPSSKLDMSIPVHYGSKQGEIETLNLTLSHERGSERSE